MDIGIDQNELKFISRLYVYVFNFLLIYFFLLTFRYLAALACDWYNRNGALCHEKGRERLGNSKL